MIVSFGDRATEDLYNGAFTHRMKRFPAEIAAVALRKLDMLESANSLNDLMVPPGNRLEALSGALKEYHSIRVNARWRIIFRWRGKNASGVSLVDYH